MENPIVPEEQTANAGNADSASATVELVEIPESAGSEPETSESLKTPESSGSEPQGESKSIEELKAQRKKRQEAEAEAAYWKSKAAELQTAKTEPSEKAPEIKNDPNLPRSENFENWDDYLVARAKYEIKKETQDKLEQEKRQTIELGYVAKFKKAASTIPDLAETIEKANIPMSQTVLDGIKESELGPEIAYHLAKNLEEALRISSLSPLAAMKELGALEIKLKLSVAPAQTRQVSQAPEPIRPIGTGTSGVQKSLEEMSDAEFIKFRNAQELAKRRGVKV